MQTDINQQAFFELLRAGLWGKDARLAQYGDIDYAAIMQLVEEQSVVGLVTAGLEHVMDVVVPKVELLQFIGQTLQIEEQNKDLNAYVGKLICQLRKQDVYAILVKGQGIAQCYERPLWRSSGDIDLLLSNDNYERAKKVLLPLAIEVDTEYKSFKHLGITMEGDFVVELHGTQHTRLSRRVDRMIDKAQKDIFYGGSVRSWLNGNTTVFLPSPDSDVIFVFTHILHHFFIDGVGLRQISDWCRLLWTYREKLDVELLESRLREAGLMSEWGVFATLAVQYLGIPEEAMPMFGSSVQVFKSRAERVMGLVLEAGDMGHNRPIKWSKNRLVQKLQSAWRKMSDLCRLSSIFPLDSLRFSCHFIVQGVRNAIKGE